MKYVISKFVKQYSLMSDFCSMGVHKRGLMMVSCTLALPLAHQIAADKSLSPILL